MLLRPVASLKTGLKLANVATVRPRITREVIDGLAMANIRKLRDRIDHKEIRDLSEAVHEASKRGH